MTFWNKELRQVRISSGNIYNENRPTSEYSVIEQLLQHSNLRKAKLLCASLNTLPEKCTEKKKYNSMHT
jgi:hypothetical protein